METNNIGYSGRTFEITISAYITDPAAAVSNVFFVTIENGCRDLSVLPPNPLGSPPFEFELWKLSTYGFSYGQLEPVGVQQEPWYNCGTLKYTLVDALTEQPVDASVFSLSTASSQSLRFLGKPVSRDPWLLNSPYEYKI